MSTIKDRAARDMIIRARTNLLVSNGFFGFLAMQLRLVEVIDPAEVIAIWGSEKAATMAVDGVSMFYAPPFVHKLTERECEGVIAHEVMHCCFQHFTRRQKRDAKLWNIAGDYVINGDIVGSGFVLPGKPMSKAQLLDPKYKEPGYMLDPLYKASTTEEVYDDLYKDVPKIYVRFVNGDGSDPGGCGGVMDAPGDRGKQDAIQQGWEASVRAAVAVAAANNVGQIPGSLRNLIENLNRPKVSWRDKTRRFVDQSMSKEISWSRLSRRSASIGVLMPGMISDRLNKLVFINDISGSVSFELAREMISENCRCFG
jgi:predicted metal-dependent peptidase